MKKALLLFTQHSVDVGHAKPKELKRLIEAASEDQLQVDTATYDQLLFEISTGSVEIKLPELGLELSEYDVIYQRRISENAAESMAVGKFALHHNIPVMDEDMALRPGSMNKLTQYVQFGLHAIPIPRSIYASSHEILLAAAKQTYVDIPFIAKSIKATRGGDNYLVASLPELESLMSAYPDVPFILQQFIPNSYDYRVWVCGDEVGPILQRSRSSGHLNNTSQGGQATLVQTDDFPNSALEMCIKANRLLRRDVSGVDVIFDSDDLKADFYILEANRAPQIEGTPFEDLKAKALSAYLFRKAR